MSRISKLSKLSNISRIGASADSTLSRAFWFDWINDFITSNATIGRTGYDMNVSGNVSTGSDADGNYMSFTLSPVSLVVSTTAIPNVSLSLAHSIAIKIKTWSDVTTTQTVFNNIVSASNRVGISIVSWELRAWIYNWTSYIGKKSFAVSTNTTYIIHYTWDWSSVWKIYSASVESTTVPAWDPSTSWTVWVSISRNWSGFGWFVYWCACWNKELSQAEVTSDYWLWNTAKNDPSIVAYYIPDNLTYNSQYLVSPNDVWVSPWVIYPWYAVVDPWYYPAPDGTNTARLVYMYWWLPVYQEYAWITWATMASKTFVFKAFIKAEGASYRNFYLTISHWWVATYYSSVFTASASERQEFTFTKTFTSSTSWTNIVGGFACYGWNTSVLYITGSRLYLDNEVLRDESPNIGGYIWRKTPLVLSTWVKPDINSTTSDTKQTFLQVPRHYIQLKWSTNVVNFKSATTLENRIAPTSTLWSWFVDQVHIIWVKYRDATWRKYKLYVDWALVSWSQTAYTNTIRPATTIYRTNVSLWFYSTDYFDWAIRDTRIYTFTWSFLDADATLIYEWSEPSSAGITKYLHYLPPPSETWTSTADQSTNWRDWTLNGWVTRPFI